ncbi:hypothetical protein BDV12DRAFT_64480 [Aspergillus spectabilis]
MPDVYPETAGQQSFSSLTILRKLPLFRMMQRRLLIVVYYHLTMVEVKFNSTDLDTVAVKYAKRITQIIKGWDNGGIQRLIKDRE